MMLKISKIAVPGVAEPYDIGTLSIPFGQVDSTSTDTAYTAQIEGITSLYDGVCVYLKNGVITSNKNGFTLNINSLGAKPVYDTLAAATRSGTVFNVDYTMLFVYNGSRVSGGCWDIFYGYNSDTTDLEEALTPLTGTTATLTPMQVYNAIKSGKSVVLQYMDDTYGLLSYTNFNVAESMNKIVANTIAYFQSTYVLVELWGDTTTNVWGFETTSLAQKEHSHSLNELGICYANCTTAFTTTAKTAVVVNYKLVLGGLVAIKFTHSVIAHSTLNINNTGAKDIYYNGVAIQSNIIQSGDIALFVYDGRRYDLLTTNFKNTLPVTETNYIWCNTKAAATIKTATLPDFSLPTGANSPTTRMAINFEYGVPANAKLNISNTGARNIICNNANITANTIQANDVVTLETYWNAALTTPTAQYIVRAIDRNNIRHVYQNTLGINNISTKNVTGHIYESPIDIKGYLSTTMEIGSVTVTNPSVHIYNNMNSFANVAPDIVGQQIGTAYVQNGAEEYIAPIICDSIIQTTPVSLQTHLANLTIPANSTPSYKLQIICPKK